MSNNLTNFKTLTFDSSNGGHTNFVGKLATIIDKNTNAYLLASGGDDYVVKVWDLKLKKLKYSFNQTDGGHEYPIFDLIYLKKSNLLASGSSDNTIKFWNLTSGRLKFTFNLTSVNKIVSLEESSVNCCLLASGGYRVDFSIKIWNVTSMSLKYSLSGHSGAIRSLISLDHLGLLASGSDDGSVKIWNLTNGSLKYSLDHKLLGLAWYQKFSQVNSLAFENKLMLLGVGILQ